MKAPSLRLRRAARAAVLAIAALGSACTTLIGVRDIYFDESAEAGSDAGAEGASSDGRATSDGPATCSSDLATDRNNCGACGHDCTNGTCEGGLCILAEELASPVRVVVRNESMYIGLAGGHGAIVSCPTTGCTNPAVTMRTLTVDAGDVYPARIAATDLYVYASDDYNYGSGGVRRVLATGGDFRRLPDTAPKLPPSYGIALDAHAVYWMTTGSAGNIHWCDLPDCANGLQSAAPTSAGELIAVAADGTIVWSEHQGGALMRCAGRAACTPQALVPDPGPVIDLFIDGSTVYWATSSGELLSCPVEGCATATKLVAEGNATIGAIALRGSALYWSSMPYTSDRASVLDAEGSIKTCTLPSCSAADIRTIATKQHDPLSLSVDERSVYWVNSGKRHFLDGVGNAVKAAR